MLGEEVLQQDVGAEARTCRSGQQNGQGTVLADVGVVELVGQVHQAIKGREASCKSHIQSGVPTQSVLEY